VSLCFAAATEDPALEAPMFSRLLIEKGEDFG
jgi:hypothetical protein